MIRIRVGGNVWTLHLLRALSTVVKCRGCIAGMNAHAHLLHPVCARGIINQLAKKLVRLLAVSLERFV